MSIVREKRTVLDFGLRLRTALPLYNSGPLGLVLALVRAWGLALIFRVPESLVESQGFWGFSFFE